MNSSITAQVTTAPSVVPYSRGCQELLRQERVTIPQLQDLDAPAFGEMESLGCLLRVFLGGALVAFLSDHESVRRVVYYQRYDLWLAEDLRCWIRAPMGNAGGVYRGSLVNNVRPFQAQDLTGQDHGRPTGPYQRAAQRVLERYKAGDSHPLIVAGATELLLLALAEDPLK